MTHGARAPLCLSDAGIWPLMVKLKSILLRIYGLSYAREKNAIPPSRDRRNDSMAKESGGNVLLGTAGTEQQRAER